MTLALKGGQAQSEEPEPPSSRSALGGRTLRALAATLPKAGTSSVLCQPARSDNVA